MKARSFSLTLSPDTNTLKFFFHVCAPYDRFRGRRLGKLFLKVFLTHSMQFGIKLFYGIEILFFVKQNNFHVVFSTTFKTATIANDRSVPNLSK